MDPNLVVLAAGVASRMKRPAPGIEEAVARDAATKTKSMIGVGEGSRPLLDYVLWNAHAAGYRDSVIVVGENDTSIREYYGTGKLFPGLSIRYAVQGIPPGRTKPLGTADALLAALRSRPDWKGKKFTVCNSDNIYSRRALRLLLETEHPGALIAYDRGALGFSSDRVAHFAVLTTDTEGYLTGITEKPSAEELLAATDPDGRVGVSMNIFRFSVDIILPALERVPLDPVRQEKEIPKAVMLMLKEHPRSVRALPLAEEVPDLTSQGDIAQMRDYLRREFPEFPQKGV